MRILWVSLILIFLDEFIRINHEEIYHQWHSTMTFLWLMSYLENSTFLQTFYLHHTKNSLRKSWLFKFIFLFQARLQCEQFKIGFIKHGSQLVKTNYTKLRYLGGKWDAGSNNSLKYFKRLFSNIFESSDFNEATAVVASQGCFIKKTLAPECSHSVIIRYF